ncbi:MAG: radical SAM family heme chaperone HemW [Coxiellaceae bacterium]|nr:radical SAM family heme chaperone HemW [Coxiellaceae bacterium]
MSDTIQNTPLSLYIHMPWCVQKCPYCDFNSHALRGDIPEKQYIDQLIKDYTIQHEKIVGRPIQSIFIGGGTPSLISAEGYDYLFSQLRLLNPWLADIEVTLEANPGAIEAQRFAGYRRAGINRLSIGVQSFDNQQLKTLGRIHDSDQAVKAFNLARDAGFNNINLDIMYALPNQSVEHALADLEKAISLTPEHISWYQLTLEPNTLFYHQPPAVPDEDHIISIEQAGRPLLAQHGYLQYEVSAYGQINHQCQHNINYWQFGDYLGIGAGAHSKLSLSDGSIQRRSNIKHPKAYLGVDDNFTQQQSTLTDSDKIFEFMLNALRLCSPISFALFERRTGLKRDKIQHTLEKLACDDLLKLSSNEFETTLKGKQFINSLISCFLVD